MKSVPACLFLSSLLVPCSCSRVVFKPNTALKVNIKKKIMFIDQKCKQILLLTFPIITYFFWGDFFIAPSMYLCTCTLNFCTNAKHYPDKLYWRRTIILIYLMIYYRLASKVGEGYTCSNGSRDRAVGRQCRNLRFLFLDWRLKSAAGDFFGA